MEKYRVTCLMFWINTTKEGLRCYQPSVMTFRRGPIGVELEMNWMIQAR